MVLSSALAVLPDFGIGCLLGTSAWISHCVGTVQLVSAMAKRKHLGEIRKTT
jgi:hypothetical protein